MHGVRVRYDFLATICGIMSDARFSSVRIAPALGELKQVSGTMPHPNGIIMVDLTRKGENGISGEITLPENVKGIFIWNGSKTNLKGGKQKVEF
jgi:hypothetical protein